MAEKKVWAHLSYRIAILRQSIEFGEQVFNLVPLPVSDFAIWFWLLPGGRGWNAGFDFPGSEGLSECVAVIPLVTDQGPGIRQGGQHDPCALVVAHLPFG